MTKLQLAERLNGVSNIHTPKEAADCVYNSIKNSDVTFLAIKQRKIETQRILEETATVTPTTPTLGEPNDNKIYVKPDAIYGMGLSLFIFFVAYVGVMCLYNTNSPLTVPRKAFKFGREM